MPEKNVNKNVNETYVAENINKAKFFQVSIFFMNQFPWLSKKLSFRLVFGISIYLLLSSSLLLNRIFAKSNLSYCNSLTVLELPMYVSLNISIPDIK